MPGIVGLVTARPPEHARRELDRMMAALYREPFHESGTWIDESLGVYVGWSARRGSFASGMPLADERGDLVGVFSGEEISGLEAGDGAYVLRSYREDASFPAALNGRFHGIVADRTRGAAMLFNDRFGMHRLYQHQASDGFYFAAEAKAILAVRPELRRIDPRGLGELVSCGCVLENRTLFEGIRVLPGASAWVLRGGGVERAASYFRPAEWEAEPALDPEGFYRELRDVFCRILPRYFAGPEAVGLSLTGGLDTRMILSARAPAAGSLPCYTFAGMFRDCHDARVARQVARACRQSHQVLRVDADFLSRFAEHAERTVVATDGCADVRRAPDLYLNAEARSIAPVRMTGNYGGEVLRGVVAFKPAAPLPGLYSPDLLSWVRKAEETYAAVRAGHPLSFAVFRQAPWHHYGLLALEESQLSLRSPFLDNELVRTVYRAPETALATDELCLRLIADTAPELRRIPTDLGRGGSGRGAAIRAAILALQFKAEYGYDYGMPQWVAPIDRLLSPLGPERLFLGRHKFAHFRFWYRGVLSAHVRAVLLDPRTLALPYVDRKTIETLVADHLAGRRNHTAEIHRLLTLEIIERRLLRG